VKLLQSQSLEASHLPFLNFKYLLESLEKIFGKIFWSIQRFHNFKTAALAQQ